MSFRHTLTLTSLVAAALGGCGMSHSMDEDGGPPPMEDGGPLPIEDAGPVVIDAGPPMPACEGLGEVACNGAAGCVATYHDACCSTCEPGLGCADCTDWEFWSCETRVDGCSGTLCGQTAAWECPELGPDCGSAVPTGLGSCSVPGCVPAVAAEGFMDPVEPCVAVTAASCTVACRAVMPNCPEGTTAEGDGSCWTGRCIPAEICGR